MDDRKKAISALTAVFPTIETFRHFRACDKNAEKVNSFVRYAHSAGVIEDNSSEKFEIFIRQHSLGSEQCSVSSDLTLEYLLENRESLFDFRKSVSALTYEINKEIRKHIPEMPTISKSMFTRLRQEFVMTAHKENILRCFAFWLGLKRPGFKWNYEKLFKLCKENQNNNEIYLNIFCGGGVNRIEIYLIYCQH